MCKISVVMACRNSSAKRLDSTIMSVLNQTYSNFEFIIVDDGSEDSIKSILNKFSDNRLKFYSIPKSGLGAALNFGIDKSSGQYIARIDDDDIMVESRLQKQMNYLDNNKNVVCVGTQIYLKYNNRYLKYRRFPLDSSKIIKCLINLHFCIAHSTIMFRKDTFEKIGKYRILGGGQDLDLFFQLATQGELHNINEYLNYYTLSLNGLSVNNMESKNNSYLYALRQIQENQHFKRHYKQIAETIKQLNKKRIRSKIKRKILIIYLILLGRKTTL